MLVFSHPYVTNRWTASQFFFLRSVICGPVDCPTWPHAWRTSSCEWRTQYTPTIVHCGSQSPSLRHDSCRCWTPRCITCGQPTKDIVLAHARRRPRSFPATRITKRICSTACRTMTHKEKGSIGHRWCMPDDADARWSAADRSVAPMKPRSITSWSIKTSGIAPAAVDGCTGGSNREPKYSRRKNKINQYRSANAKYRGYIRLWIADLAAASTAASNISQTAATHHAIDCRPFIAVAVANGSLSVDRWVGRQRQQWNQVSIVCRTAT